MNTLFATTLGVYMYLNINYVDEDKLFLIHDQQVGNVAECASIGRSAPVGHWTILDL